MIFIETSVQTDRILLESIEQEQLEAHIESLSPHLYTSNYVWMEFQRTVVSDMAHVKHVMLTQSGWGGLMRNLHTGQRAFRARSASRCSTIAGHLYDYSHSEWAYALELCDAFLDEDLEIHFWTNVNPLSDPINCDLVAKGTTLQSDGRYNVADTCNKEHATCHLPNFLRQNADKLRAIHDYLNIHPHAIKDQARVQRLLELILENPQAALGQNSCWPLGDIIIALQVPDGASVWTRDADFEPIAESLGLRLYTPSI